MRQTAVSAFLCLAVTSASAGLFEDEEARRAILEVRERVEAMRVQAEQSVTRAADENSTQRRGVLELQNQIEGLRSDVAKLRGQNEQLTRDVSDLQRQQKDTAQSMEERLRQFEPVKVNVDGREFSVQPAEKREFEAALTVFRKSEFAAAQTLFVEFLKRYSQSGYSSSALFWLGNAQYATRDYKEAMINFRALIARDAEHVRAPEAVLSIANCQLELKDTKAARKTLEDLMKAYPQSEAAVAAKERLARLK